MPNVVMYSSTPCPYCSQAKALLNAREIPFEEINLSKDAEGRVALNEKTGMMTFPQVLVDDELIGGFQELMAADQSGKLAELLGARQAARNQLFGMAGETVLGCRLDAILGAGGMGVTYDGVDGDGGFLKRFFLFLRGDDDFTDTGIVFCCLLRHGGRCGHRHCQQQQPVVWPAGRAAKLLRRSGQVPVAGHSHVRAGRLDS